MKRMHGWSSDSDYGEDMDLEAHNWESQMSSTDNEDNSMACNFCDNTFGNKQDLMTHKKAEHTEKVKHCWHFAAGTCPFSKNNSNFSEYT